MIFYIIFSFFDDRNEHKLILYNINQFNFMQLRNILYYENNMLILKHYKTALKWKLF